MGACGTSGSPRLDIEHALCTRTTKAETEQQPFMATALIPPTSLLRETSPTSSLRERLTTTLPRQAQPTHFVKNTVPKGSQQASGKATLNWRATRASNVSATPQHRRCADTAIESPQRLVECRTMNRSLWHQWRRPWPLGGVAEAQHCSRRPTDPSALSTLDRRSSHCFDVPRMSCNLGPYPALNKTYHGLLRGIQKPERGERQANGSRCGFSGLFGKRLS